MSSSSNVTLGEIQVPAFMTQEFTRSLENTADLRPDLVLSAIYSHTNTCVIVPYNLSGAVRQCLYNSGNHGTGFYYNLDLTDVQFVSDANVANRMKNIRSRHTAEAVISASPSYQNLPQVHGSRAMAPYMQREPQEYTPAIVTFRFTVPRRLIENARPWHCTESIRNCLENLIMFSASPETKREFREVYRVMNASLRIYNDAERAPTLSQKFLSAVTMATEAYTGDEDQPEGLNFALRPHQRRSLHFCVERERRPRENISIRLGSYRTGGRNGEERPIYYSPVLKLFSTSTIQSSPSGLLLDEMGLGKTAVTLALHLANPPAERDGMGGTLVICPPALVHQWVGEAKKTLRSDNDMYIFHGPRRIRDGAFLLSQDLVVTTYGVVNSEARGEGQSCLTEFTWNRVVFDESHTIRNCQTHTYRACKNLKARHKWVCTGTPFVSSVEDLPSQINLVSDYGIRFRSTDYYGSMKRFVYIIMSMAIRHTTSMRIGGVPLLNLQDIVREDVPLEWDTLEEKNRYKEEEAIVFHNVQNASAGVALGQVAKLQKRCAVGFNNNISFDRRETGFLVMTEEESRFAEERLDSCPICMEDVEMCNAALVRPCRHLYCAVCIQTHIQHGASACPLCRGPLSRRNVCVPPLEQSNSNGSSNNPFRQSKSPKIEKLMNLITGSEPDDKFLVFSNFKDVVRFTKMRLEDESIPCVAFLPGMSLSHRRKGLEKFQTDPTVKVLILPMRTSSSGLNITAANKIIIMEPTLHKNTERQAIGRCWRMGQLRQVSVYTMHMKGTVEEKIREMNSTTESSRIDSRWNHRRIFQLFQ